VRIITIIVQNTVGGLGPNCLLRLTHNEWSRISIMPILSVSFVLLDYTRVLIASSVEAFSSGYDLLPAPV